MSTRTIADPTTAPTGRDPRLVGVDYITPQGLRRQRYRTEAWDLVDGTRVVIVTENGGTSLENGRSMIAAAVTDRWGDGAGLVPDIIEDWTDQLARFDFFDGARFLFAPGEGMQALPLDFDKWDARGLVLPR